MGTVLYWEGKPEQSVKYFYKALSLDPYATRFYRNLAQVFIKLGQRSLAQEALEKSRRPPPWERQ